MQKGKFTKILSVGLLLSLTQWLVPVKKEHTPPSCLLSWMKHSMTRVVKQFSFRIVIRSTRWTYDSQKKKPNPGNCLQHCTLWTRPSFSHHSIHHILLQGPYSAWKFRAEAVIGLRKDTHQGRDWRTDPTSHKFCILTDIAWYESVIDAPLPPTDVRMEACINKTTFHMVFSVDAQPETQQSLTGSQPKAKHGLLKNDTECKNVLYCCSHAWLCAYQH